MLSIQAIQSRLTTSTNMDISNLTSVGIAGPILVVLWWVIKLQTNERARYVKTMEDLQSDIRNKFSTQLMENTNALMAHNKIMKQVLLLLQSINRK
jgi:hypothetical protein